MTGFIDKLHERQAEITASISALVIERDEIDAALRVFERFGGNANSPDWATEQREHVLSQREGQSGDEPPPEQQRNTVGVTAGETAPVSSQSDEGQAAGKPAGSQGSAAPSLLSRVRTYMDAHPDATARDCADALGVETVKVRNTARGVVVFAPTRSPVHRRFDPDPGPAPTPEPAITFVPPPGEMSERTAKRIEVASLHRREPWLTPEEAAARLFIPIVNLRIFTEELEIEWSQQRDAGPSSVQAPAIEPRTLRDRVAAMHRMHPTWGAGMISKELGCAYGSAGTYLAEARRAEREQQGQAA